ncbi:hypothetical protein BN946_scf184971.g14 [Trametes cinnabarina]|uniref:Cytochrome c domain-containing protein n=1 Tax=Pycnoporus cinnabarinus TaxID=5643 RepID=A0A060T0B6_PYCCI|nr:hypothetical protein BN946_scf184971.g14 [Trametes cinnabarina]
MSANDGNTEETPRECLDRMLREAEELRTAVERDERERTAREKAEREQQEREAREKVEQERLAKEKAENERKEREATESRKRPAGEAPRGTPPKKTRRGKGKAREEDEPVELSVPCDYCKKTGQRCLYRGNRRARSCLGCHAAHVACQTGGKPSAGPVEKEAEGAAVPGSSRGRAVWQAEPGEPGRLTGEELMQTLLVEVQGLRRSYDRTSEELKFARKELRTLRESAEVLLKEAEWRKAQVQAYVEYLEEEAAAENNKEYEGASGEESEGEDSEDSDSEGEEEV